jgi:4-amino-4-deoxy-L-arabinose transferase-like glycosyltransferase
MMLFPRLKTSSTETGMNTDSRRSALLAVLSVLLLLHLAKAAAFIAAGQQPLQSDAVVYWSLGERIVAGDWLLLADPPEITRTPAYPYYVAFFQATCGRHALAAAIIVQQLLLLANVALTAWACWRLTGKRGSILLCLVLSLGCFSCYGVGVQLLSDTLLCFLLTLSLALAVAWRRSPSSWLALGLGIALGGAVLTKPVALFAGLIVCVWMLLGRGEFSWQKRVAHCGLVVVTALALVAPWLVRNKVNFGQPFLARVAGRSLWWSCFKGNPADKVDPPIPFADGPATRAILQAVKTVSPHDTWRLSKELIRLGCSESTADDLMFRAAREAIRQNPWKYIVSRCRRYVWFWLTPNGTFRPNTGDYSFKVERADLTYGTAAPKGDEGIEVGGQSTWHAAWYFKQGRLNFLWRPNLLIYAVAVLACVLSIGILALTAKTRGLALFFVCWLGYFSAVTVLMACPEYRYRMILEPAMIILVVTGTTEFVKRIALRRDRSNARSHIAGGV